MVGSAGRPPRQLPELPTAPPFVRDYRLLLDVDFEGARWKGTVAFDVDPGTEALTLDADGLEVSAVRRNHRSLEYRLDPAARTLELDWGSPGASTVEVDFSGVASDTSLIGLYRCRHADGYVLTSQCEPTGARRIFPCIDRPDRKARIHLTVRAPPGLDVVSNTAPTSVKDGGRRREWVFGPTPVMATYLFYLAVGRFAESENRSTRVPIRVLAPPGRGPAGRFAAENGSRILEALERYYGIPYPLPKLDFVAVSTQAFGAMENWGAICFTDGALLIDAASASMARRNVFETIAHEVAHQWFGNLVTMHWWDDIWLNESFATLIQSTITGELEPGYDTRSSFLLRPAGVGPAMEEDSLASTHPVRARVDRPEEISQIFDGISYGKGAGVLRMLEAYLGAATFREGVTLYLLRHQYGNARTQDLWEALGERAGRSVASVVSPWIDRPGHPVVHARPAGEGLELEQRRFTYRGEVESEPWPIPLRIDLGDEVRSLVFDSAQRSVPVPSGAAVHLNPGALGFYRVFYEGDLLDRLLAVFPARSKEDRWTVLKDLAAFLFAGTGDWRTYERGLGALGPSPSRLEVEEVANTLLHWTLAYPERTEVAELARRFVRDRLDVVGVDRGPAESHDAGLLRQSLSFAGVRLDPMLAEHLAPRFSDWSRLDPDLRQAVAIARARTGGESAFRELRRTLEGARTEVDELRLERGLAWSGEPSLVAEVLDLGRSGALNRGHVWAVIENAAVNPVGRPLVEPWLERHLPALCEMFRGSGLPSMILERALPWCGLGRAEEVRAAYHDLPLREARRGAAKGLEWLAAYERLADRLPP